MPEAYTLTTDVNLNLTNLPQVDDPKVYEALLQFRDAIDLLATAADTGDINAFIAKQRSVRTIVTNDAALLTDGVIVLNTSAAPVDLLLPLTTALAGNRYRVACEDGSYIAKVSCDATESINGDGSTFELYEGEYIDLIADAEEGIWRIS